MPASIILRFTNHEADTIAKHRDLIDTEGHVWWGWWKKSHEKGRLDTFSELEAELPTNIYLLYRGINKVYSAHCVDIEYSNTGDRIPSPDITTTPDYYENSNQPAWFKLESIEHMDVDEFEDQMNGIPQGDPSLFVVQNSSENRIAEERKFSVGEMTDCQGDTILHISDLHFGAHHGYPYETEAVPRDPKLLDVLTEGIEECGVNIGVVVVSGDLTSRGDSDHLIKAANFIEELLDRLGLEKNHLVVVPGNHDIWIEDEETATRDYDHEEPYREFLRSRLNTDELRQLRSYNLSSNWKLSFCGLNSIRPREDRDMHLGYVGSDRSEPVLNAIADETPLRNNSESNHITFAVLHHHVLPTEQVMTPGERGEVSITLDAGQLIQQFKQAGVDIILHGHRHIPFVGSTDRLLSEESSDGLDKPIYVFGSGSTGVSVEHLPDENRNNTFSLYTPQDATLRVQVLEFNSRYGPKEIIDTQIPLRSRSHDSL